MKIRDHRIALLLLFTIPLVVYAFSLNHEFIPYLDDSAYVIGNSAIRGFTQENLTSAFTRYFVGNYAPLQIISYMMDYTLWGLNPRGYILTNIILHTLNGLLFYLLIVRSEWSRLSAWAAAVVFLIHPVQVESVIWISQRKTVLAMFFFLISFHCYLSWRNNNRLPMRQTNYLLSLFFFTLSILSKSVAVILPFALIIHDFGNRDNDTKQLQIKDKIPYFLIALTGALLAFRSQEAAMGGGRADYYGGSPLTTFYTMLPVLMKYLGLVFWPSNQGIDYPVEIKMTVDSEVATACLAAIALIGLGVMLFLHKRDHFRWYALFFLGLVPVSQIIPIVTLMNDRYLYFPLLGAAPFVCGCVTTVLQKRPDWRHWVAAICGVVLVSLPILTLKRADVWKNSVTVWNDVVRMTPDNRLAWHILLDENERRGDHDSALKASLSLLSIFPDDPTGLKATGMLLTNKGEIYSGRGYLEFAASIYPNDPEIRYLLADNYLKTGELKKAAEVLRYILILNPGSERAIEALRKIERY